MRNKILAGVLCLLIVFSSLSIISVSAESSENTVAKAENFIDGIVSQKHGSNDPQSWIYGELSRNAGYGSEWYILSLSQYGYYDFSSYEENLLAYLKNNSVSSASSRLKYALCLSAVGSTDSYINKTIADSIGKQGILSYVFGLHVLNNASSDSSLKTSVINSILSLQNSDGGWAVTGAYSDVDTTAMAVQALAAHYNSKSKVQSAVNRAISWLSARQKNDGNFASYGVSNLESTAQVLVALSSLYIDCKSDSRFIKNGNTLFDGIEKYRLSDGSFCHKVGGTANAIATEQVFYSMIAYLRMVNHQTPLYDLDKAVIVHTSTPAQKPSDKPNGSDQANQSKPSANKSENTQNNDKPANSDVGKETQNSENSTLGETQSSENSTLGETQTQSTIISEDETTTSVLTEDETSLATFDESKATNNPYGYKLWAIISIVCVGLVICAVLLILKKRNYKNFIAIAILTAVAVLIVCLTNFSCADDYYNGKDVIKENAIGKVTMTIRCDTIVGKAQSKHIPENGIILKETEFSIEAGDTAYDILIEAARKYNIQVENEGSAEMAYISGINYLYEFDFGDLSGWVYHVNAVAPSVGCGEYTLSDGDNIEWHYTCNLGNDIK